MSSISICKAERSEEVKRGRSMMMNKARTEDMRRTISGRCQPAVSRSGRRKSYWWVRRKAKGKVAIKRLAKTMGFLSSRAQANGEPK